MLTGRLPVRALQFGSAYRVLLTSTANDFCGRYVRLPAGARPRCLLLGLLLAGHLAPAHALLHLTRHQNFAVHPDHGEKDVHRIIAGLEDQWHGAQLSGDLSTVDKLLADDYVGIGPDGTISSKADELAARKAGERKFSRLSLEERKIRVYGTTAVVTSRASVTGMYDTMPLDGEFRYTRVYNLSHGQWRIVSFEASPITVRKHVH